MHNSPQSTDVGSSHLLIELYIIHAVRIEIRLLFEFVLHCLGALAVPDQDFSRLNRFLPNRMSTIRLSKAQPARYGPMLNYVASRCRVARPRGEDGH